MTPTACARHWKPSSPPVDKTGPTTRIGAPGLRPHAWRIGTRDGDDFRDRAASIISEPGRGSQTGKLQLARSGGEGTSRKAVGDGRYLRR